MFVNKKMSMRTKRAFRVYGLGFKSGCRIQGHDRV
jgi:hypothetical protein